MKDQGEWVKQLEVTRINKGIPCEVVDAIGTPSLTLYDKNNLLPIAHFANASLQDQIFYYGFEPYEDLSACSPNITTFIDEDCAYTGSCCLHLPATEPQSVTLNPPVSQNLVWLNQYLLNFFYQMPSGSDNTSTISVNFTMDPTIPLLSVSLESTQGRWVYKSIVVDLTQARKTSPDKFKPISVTVANPKGTNEIYIDNIWLMPLRRQKTLPNPPTDDIQPTLAAAGAVTINVYDTQTQDLVATIDSNGQTTRYVYDARRQLIGIADGRGDDCNNTMTMNASFYSRETIDNPSLANNFNKINPNSRLALQARSGGECINFSKQLDLTLFPNWDFGNATMQGNTCVLPKNSESEKGVTYTIPNDLVEYGVAVRLQFVNLIPALTQQEITVIGLANAQTVNAVKINCVIADNHICYKIYSIDSTAPIASVVMPNNEGFSRDWLLIMPNDQFYFYVGGRQIASAVLQNPLINLMIMPISTDIQSVQLANIMVARDPLITEVYIDAANKPRQTQSYITVPETVAMQVQEKMALNVSEQLYDELERPVIKTVTVTKGSGSSLGFYPEFIKERNFSIWRERYPQSSIYRLEGDITHLVDHRFIGDNREYAYMATYYESSPLSRVIQTTLPDKEFLYSSNNEALDQWLSASGSPISPASHAKKNYYGYLPDPIKAALAEYLLIPANDLNQHFKVGFQLARLSQQEQVASAQVTDLLGRPVAEMTMSQNKKDFLLSSIRWSYVSAIAYSNQVCAVMKEYSPPSNYLEGKPCKVTEYYDMGGRLIGRISADEGSKQYYYDNAGRLIFMSDQQDDELSPSGTRVKYHQYDSLNRLNKISYFEAPKTVWYPVGTILADYLTDPSSLPTLNVLVEYIYDVASAPTGGIELNMEETVLNNIGRLVKVVTYPFGNVEGPGKIEEYYAYNELGNTIAKGMIAAPAPLSQFTQLTAYKYDNLKNVTSIYYPQGWDITKTKVINYNALFPDAAPLLVAYDYDISGHLKAITGHDNRTPNQPPKTPEYARYFYNPDRTLAVEYLAAGKICRTRQYNTLNQLEMINDQFIEAAPQSKNLFSQKLDYQDQTGYRDGYICSNNLTFFKSSSATEPQSIAETTTYSYSYEYDAYGRLKTVQLPGNIVNEQFDYSANGNTLSHVTKGNTVNYTYKDNNRLETVTINGTVGQYTYQPNGMVQSTPKWPGVTYNELYPYLPNSMIREDGSQIDFYYDHQGERVLGGATIMYWRGLGIKPLVEQFELPGSRQFHIYGLNGLLLFSNQLNDQCPWIDHYLLTDHSGSLRMALSQQQEGEQYTVDAYFDYTAYGEIINNNSGGSLTNFRYFYTGQERDLDDYNYHARLYDSQMGRFLAPDPSHQFPSPYMYAGNNPINVVDSTGRVGRYIHSDRNIRNLATLINHENRPYIMGPNSLYSIPYTLHQGTLSEYSPGVLFDLPVYRYTYNPSAVHQLDISIDTVVGGAQQLNLRHIPVDARVRFLPDIENAVTWTLLDANATHIYTSLLTGCDVAVTRNYPQRGDIAVIHSHFRSGFDSELNMPIREGSNRMYQKYAIASLVGNAEVLYHSSPDEYITAPRPTRINNTTRTTFYGNRTENNQLQFFIHSTKTNTTTGEVTNVLDHNPMQLAPTGWRI